MAYLKFDKTKLVNLEYSLKRELIRTNSLGTYACTTLVGCNTRKYHGLLICSLPKIDGGRHVLVSTVHETIIQHNTAFNLGMHKYAGDNYDPKGHKYMRDFSSNPIPKQIYRVGGVVFSKEIILSEFENRVLIRYTLEQAKSETILQLKPFLAFRNIHALSKANMDVNHHFYETKNGIATSMYPAYPLVYFQHSKPCEFIAAPDWYYNIEYRQEQKRGYPYKEDLYVPGYFELPMQKGETIIFSAGLTVAKVDLLQKMFTHEVSKRIPRNSFENCLINTTKQFFLNNENEIFITAGHPWLPVQARDTLIALPGLAIPNHDEQIFKKVLDAFIHKLDGHFVPEQLLEHALKQYAPDTPLWFIWTLQQYKKQFPSLNVWKNYGSVLTKIMKGYLQEKQQFVIDKSGLPYIFSTNHENSWMHASIAGEPVIKRFGYLVEFCALWYNAIGFTLEYGSHAKNKTLITKLQELFPKVKESFHTIFWLEDKGYLADFVNASEICLQIRPNQLFAASLDYSPLEKNQIKSVLDLINSQLLTNLGLRTLSPIDPNYQPKYKGNHQEREIAAYNGSVWPWLFTHFYEAWRKIQLSTADRLAKQFIINIESEIQINGICSISELYHADPPHKGKGAISFAMNTGELIRLKWLLNNNNP
jgi:predicted glycogen debranching enzyme